MASTSCGLGHKSQQAVKLHMKIYQHVYQHESFICERMAHEQYQVS